MVGGIPTYKQHIGRHAGKRGRPLRREALILLRREGRPLRREALILLRKKGELCAERTLILPKVVKRRARTLRRALSPLTLIPVSLLGVVDPGSPKRV